MWTKREAGTSFFSKIRHQFCLLAVIGRLLMASVDHYCLLLNYKKINGNSAYKQVEKGSKVIFSETRFIALWATGFEIKARYFSSFSPGLNCWFRKYFVEHYMYSFAPFLDGDHLAVCMRQAFLSQEASV